MIPLTKTTHLVALHSIPIECDVYDTDECAPNGPVLLYFHPGGLVTGSRAMVPPWLAQTCYARKWPLVSASYRLLPQVSGQGLLDDARAAYMYARGLHGGQHPVICAGSSAGFFLAALTAHHCDPKPIALLCVTGIPTFQHQFFRSSHLIPPDPVPDEDIELLVDGPMTVGTTATTHDPERVFDLDKLLASGEKNPEFQLPPTPSSNFNSSTPNRGLLYDHYLHQNMYPVLVGDIDPGFEWARSPAQKQKLDAWPVTIFIQGDHDQDVLMDVCKDTAIALGARAIFCLAKGEGHSFEGAKWLEDAGMATVRQAVAELDKAVGRALGVEGH